MNNNGPKFGGIKKLGEASKDDLKVESEAPSLAETQSEAPPILSINTVESSEPEDSVSNSNVVDNAGMDLDQTFDDFSAPSLASLDDDDAPSLAAAPQVQSAVNVAPPKEKKSGLKLATKNAAQPKVDPNAEVVNPCLACGRSRAPGAVFCLECGFNEETGQKVAPERGPSPLSVKQTEQQQKASERPIKRAPNYQLLFLVRVIISGAACAAAYHFGQTELWPKLYGFGETEIKDALTDPQFTVAQSYFQLSLYAAAGAAAWAGSLLSNLFLKSPYRSYFAAVGISFVVISLATVGLMFNDVKKLDKALYAYSEETLKAYAQQKQQEWIDGPEPRDVEEIDCLVSAKGMLKYEGIDGEAPSKKAWQIESTEFDQIIDQDLDVMSTRGKVTFPQQASKVYENLDFWRKKVYEKVDGSTE